MEVRYIGQTNNPKERYRDHVSLQKRHVEYPNKKQKWANGLLLKGFKPIMQILFECEPCDANRWEQHFINLFNYNNQLVNSAVVIKNTYQMEINFNLK